MHSVSYADLQSVSLAARLSYDSAQTRRHGHEVPWLPRAGLDSAELVSQMRAAHASDQHTRAGVDVVRGVTGDMQELGIYEAFRVRYSPLRNPYPESNPKPKFPPRQNPAVQDVHCDVA